MCVCNACILVSVHVSIVWVVHVCIANILQSTISRASEALAPTVAHMKGILYMCKYSLYYSCMFDALPEPGIGKEDNPPWLICWAFPLSCLLPLLELTSSLTKPPTRHVCTDDICSSTCGIGSERESLPAYSLLLREAFIHTKMSWCLDKCNGFSIILVHLDYNEYRITEHVLLWTLKASSNYPLRLLL